MERAQSALAQSLLAALELGRLGDPRRGPASDPPRGPGPTLLPPDAGGAAERGGTHARRRQPSAEAPRPLAETVARWRPKQPSPRPAPCQSVMERPPKAAAGAAGRGAWGPS
ncbi:hypothetical protein P7K49_035510 [Saguinus oedipus]|uniref:Uncharacterized protein n=1 Tax=Saguinus oedipus TaxID=9490 RepID=A0ABQ9TNG5_SAGOE|nr:hypothetical protein P7K49_035510 [Saguinus oedipus]